MEGVAEMTVLQYLHHVDKDLTLAINAVNSPFSDSVWLLFSNVRLWYILYLAVAVFFFIRLGWKRALVAVGACILCVIACDQTANVVKDAVERLRPCVDGEMLARGLHVLEGGGGFGFYSAHAANTFGFAVCSSGAFKNDTSGSYGTYTTAIYIWAILVSISRVFVGRHFFGDICAGSCAGLLTGWVIISIANYAIKRFKL